MEESFRSFIKHCMSWCSVYFWYAHSLVSFYIRNSQTAKKLSIVNAFFQCSFYNASAYDRHCLVIRKVKKLFSILNILSVASLADKDVEPKSLTFLLFNSTKSCIQVHNSCSRFILLYLRLLDGTISSGNYILIKN